ncbi:MAG: 5'-nucleotidase [Oscillospiraceae bacterium]|nr:5'-nucleotidase [Oscillospiraceae bacterium]
MSYDLTEPLVIGISSRALFDLEEENKIYETQGVSAYEAYQIQNEDRILKKGSAFPLAEAFLGLNKLRRDGRLVEVIVMSRNSPNTSLRIFHSIDHYGLDITRAALTGGGPIAPYLHAFRTDLFLSAYRPDVQQAIDSGFAAGMILTEGIHAPTAKAVNQIRIAFDGDAVLFSPDSERIYQKEGLEAFAAHEKQKADIPMADGPFANFLRTIAHIQEQFPDKDSSPIRTALVTARGVPAHERAIKTLRQWGVRVDEAFFLGGVGKKDVLSAFGAHIFFDDQYTHAGPASEVVPSAVVPYIEGQDPHV